jgi:hypothetical protein
VHEISQSHIDSVLGDCEEHNVGFTLNPSKQGVDVNFYDYRQHFSDRKLLVFNLTRKNILHQALSHFVSRETGKYAGTKNHKTADLVLEFVGKGVRVPPDKLEQLLKSILKSNKLCFEFSRNFAAKFDAPLVDLTYEGIYEGDHADMTLLFNTLGVTEDIPVPDHGEKLLPPPETWIRNYSEIESLNKSFLSHA